MSVRTAISLWTVLAPLCAYAGTLDTGEVVSHAAAGTLLRVADFEAVGDGVHDDGPAVQRAVATAIESGQGSKVVFEKKSYRLARHPGSAQIALEGVTGLTLEGNGAEIIGNPWNGFLSVANCRNVTMRGFVLDCDPLSFTQGDVISLEPEQRVFEMKIHEDVANTVHDHRTGLGAVFDLSDEVDAGSLLMTTNQLNLEPDFPDLMQTITGQQWTPAPVAIETTDPRVRLRFRFDCGPADNTGYDGVQIAELRYLTESMLAEDIYLRVADFAVVGDCVHDDGPAIAAAFAAAKEDGGPSTVVFEKKTYRLGDNPAAWHLP